MSIVVRNIKEIEGNQFIVNGLPSELNIADGSTVIVVWANDTHVELKTMGGARICLRTYLVFDLLTYKETI